MCIERNRKWGRMSFNRWRSQTWADKRWHIPWESVAPFCHHQTRGAPHSMEKVYEIFSEQKEFMRIFGLFLKTRGFLPKVYEIFGSEMPLDKTHQILEAPIVPIDNGFTCRFCIFHAITDYKIEFSRSRCRNFKNAPAPTHQGAQIVFIMHFKSFAAKAASQLGYWGSGGLPPENF